jgi:hypothetical protein
MIPSAHEADKLQHHDERPGSRLGETEAVHHLARLQPSVMGERLLRDVGQKGIGAAECHDRSFAEEKTFLEKSVVRA